MRELRGDYERLQDLTAVPGIKERKLRELEKYLTVGPAP
jgi:DNA uptake protein ComE-like DNA-binding protein